MIWGLKNVNHTYLGLLGSLCRTIREGKSPNDIWYLDINKQTYIHIYIYICICIHTVVFLHLHAYRDRMDFFSAEARSTASFEHSSYGS